MLVGRFQSLDACPATGFSHINVGMVFPIGGPLPSVGMPEGSIYISKDLFKDDTEWDADFRAGNPTGDNQPV